ncbi:MAG TPA: MFS transporter [Pseudobacteroides sp.]|uniref:MFS transporter n=1 Tax=Pseudobacteroides sp. TaxID=1968840 RepID=UPI002F94982A
MGNRIKGKDLRQSLTYVIIAVTLGNVFFISVGTPVGGAAFTKFAVKLGIDDFKYGIILTLAILGSVIQLPFSFNIENSGKRKLIFLAAGFIHRLLYIPIALIPLFVPSANKNLIFISIAFLIMVSSAANSVVGVAFSSWMGSLIPLRIRGRYFSKRMMIYTVSGALSGLIIGQYIDRFNSLTNYSILFIVIALFGAADIFCFIFIKDPPVETTEKQSIKTLKEPFKDKNYLKLIISVSLWNFGINLPTPFLFMFMIKQLNMSLFSIYLLSQFVSNVATILFVQHIGKAIDKYGNRPVAVISAFFISIIPFLWCFATPHNYYFIIPIASLITGIFWPGFEMSFINLSIWLAPKKHRTSYLANYTMFTSVVGIGLSYLLGSCFMRFAEPYLKQLEAPFLVGQTLNHYHALFILTFITRLLISLFFLPRINESNARSLKDMIRGKP